MKKEEEHQDKPIIPIPHQGSSHPIIPAKIQLTPIILKNQSEHDSGSSQKEQTSVQSLCSVFLERVVKKKVQTFEINDLNKEGEIKTRRIYDLLNILEGCGFIAKKAKATYDWKGFNNNISFELKKGKCQSDKTLKHLATKVKNLLIESSEPIQFKDICTEIIEENTNTGVNFESMRRRIYECCRVFLKLGLVEKKQQKYEWVSLYKIPEKEKEREKLSKRGLSSTKSRKSGINMHPQPSPLISQILEPIHTEQQLGNLIDELRFHFFKKIQKIVNRQLKFQ